MLIDTADLNTCWQWSALSSMSLEPISGLAMTLAVQGISDPKIFSQSLEEERACLEGLRHEPVQDMLEMEYYRQLVVFHEYS